MEGILRQARILFDPAFWLTAGTPCSAAVTFSSENSSHDVTWRGGPASAFLELLPGFLDGLHQLRPPLLSQAAPQDVNQRFLIFDRQTICRLQHLAKSLHGANASPSALAKQARVVCGTTKFDVLLVLPRNRIQQGDCASGHTPESMVQLQFRPWGEAFRSRAGPALGRVQLPGGSSCWVFWLVRPFGLASLYLLICTDARNWLGARRRK